MGGGNDVPLGDQNTTTLVLGEQSQPSSFSHQHLPRPFAESRTRSADNPSVFPDQRPHSANCYNIK